MIIFKQSWLNQIIPLFTFPPPLWLYCLELVNEFLKENIKKEVEFPVIDSAGKMLENKGGSS